MDNNNNINNHNNFNYNQPMQPTNQIYQNTQLNQQPIQNNNDNQKNNNKTFIIIVIVLLVIGGGIFYFTTKNKKLENEDNKNNSNQVVEPDKDNNTNNSSENTNVDNDDVNVGEAFLMPIDGIYEITGKRVVVTGKVITGTLKAGDNVQIIGLDEESKTTTVVSIETLKASTDVASAGNVVGILLSEFTKDDVKKGQVLATPNSIKAYKSFEATAKFLTKEEGGRQTPFYSNYKPLFHFRNIDVNSTITLPDNIEMVNPGDSATINVELEKSIAMKVGTEFDIMEGGRIIGTGKVTKVK